MKNTILDCSEKGTIRLIVFLGFLIMPAIFGTGTTFGQGQSQIVNFVSVGGPDAGDIDLPGTGPGADKDFALTAFKYANGSARGILVDRWLTAGPWGIRADIDCVSVDGTNAWVSGVVTQGGFPDDEGNPISLVGFFVRVRVADNGPNNDPANPDRISIVGLRNPAVNPIPFNCELRPNQTLFDMPRGQATVR